MKEVEQNNVVEFIKSQIEDIKNCNNSPIPNHYREELYGRLISLENIINEFQLTELENVMHNAIEAIGGKGAQE